MQGTGKKYLEKQLEQLETKFPTKARGIVKFNVPLAHLMTAGADYMLVPSRFEPCGLIQLHAQRYGTVSIPLLSEGTCLGTRLKCPPMHGVVSVLRCLKGAVAWHEEEQEGYVRKADEVHTRMLAREQGLTVREGAGHRAL